MQMERDKITSEKLLQQAKKLTLQIDEAIIASQVKLKNVYRNNHLQTK